MAYQWMEIFRELLFYTVLLLIELVILLFVGCKCYWRYLVTFPGAWSDLRICGTSGQHDVSKVQ